MRDDAGAIDERLLMAFERGFTEGRRLHFGYVDRFGQTTTRSVECIALMLRSPVWYVVAWDLDKDASRIFRMDRIQAPSCGEPLDERHPLLEVQAQPAMSSETGDVRWMGTPLG
jgi:predicted DNA-binding transcriptional regulator YafY